MLQSTFSFTIIICGMATSGTVICHEKRQVLLDFYRMTPINSEYELFALISCEMRGCFAVLLSVVAVHDEHYSRSIRPNTRLHDCFAASITSVD